MRRPDPLVLLTLLGLVASGALAAFHPTEPFDPSRDQEGRMVHVVLHVWAADHGEGWSRGQALPGPHSGSPLVSWTWFRPPEERPQPGDRIEGRARVESGDDRPSLVLSGPTAAVVDPGPHPVVVRWRDLADHPERYVGRLLVLNGWIEDGHLFAPKGDARCRLEGPWDAVLEPDRWRVRLSRTSDPLAWACHLEGRDR